MPTVLLISIGYTQERPKPQRIKGDRPNEFRSYIWPMDDTVSIVSPVSFSS